MPKIQPQCLGGETESPIKFLRRFSSIKVNFEKDKRKTISKYQQQGLRVSICVPKFFQDKKDVRARLRQSVERYSMPELYVKMICALFPGLKAKEMPDSNALIKHLKQVFRLADSEHSQLLEIARITKLPQRIVNLEIVEARNIPAKDINGLSDPFCVIFINSRDIAQRTKVIHNSLNPVWKQYFTFKVNDPNKDVLHLEVMDYNEEDEPLRERIKKFKEIKSPGTLGILLKEIANARSVQELIGSVRIPVNEISSETIEKWFKLKNHENRGEIYLRMALGYNKSKEAASEEFLQIIHFFLVHELDKDSILEMPFNWDEHYEVWSKYVLRQFKWQGGLKPKDIVLAKWRAYTAVNAIFPLNANMLCLLMNAVLERILSREYDSREVSRFWECAQRLVDTINSFVIDIHDVLPCPVTVLHTYHMLKTLDLLIQFLASPDSQDKGDPPFTKACIIDGITKAIRDGANKFYLKVFSDCTTHDNVGDPLLFAMENLQKMGQILHEDLRLGISNVQTDFQGVLNIDYLRITYAVYDEQYGKMVKHIVEEYSSSLLDGASGEGESDDDMDEDSPEVKIGLAVFKLYLAVKNVTDIAPPNFKSDNLSEYSLCGGFHSWFFQSVATWIDIQRKRIMKWVKTSVSISAKATSADEEDSKLSRLDVTDSKEIPISSSAIDTSQMFLEMQTFWISLRWQDPHQSYIIARKILEEWYDYLIYYAAQLQETVAGSENSEAGATSVFHTRVSIPDYLRKGCTAINNINYVKEQVERLGEQLNIQDIIKKMESLNIKEDYEGSIASLRDEMVKHVNRVVLKVMKSCVQYISPKYRQIMQTTLSYPPSSEKSSVIFQPVLDFLDNCLIIMNDNLERQNFRQLLIELWSECMEGVNQRMVIGLESGKSNGYFKILHGLVEHLNDLFWPREVERRSLASTFEKYDGLVVKLSLLQLPLEELKVKYYEHRYNRQKDTPSSKGKHGLLTVRTGYVEKESFVILELLNARNLKSYDSNNLSDPYAVVTLVPKEYFLNAPKFTTKVHKETLFPLFDETFKLTLTSQDMAHAGFLLITLYDYDFLGRDDEMGEVLLPLAAITRIGKPDVIETLSQLHLVLTKPANEDLEFLQRFEERLWDKEAIRFAKSERDKMDK